MLKKSIIIILLLIILAASECNKEVDVKKNNTIIEDKFIDYYGYLNIPSINMYLGFYEYDNPLNNVDKNIELIDTKINNTYLLAGHSGIGKNTYFNDLQYLKVNDDVYLEFINNTIHFQITNIYREIKKGKINIKKEEGQIILTTCDQIYKGYQLIIEGIKV